MLLQELWLLNLTWDEQIPHTLATRWQNIRDDLTSLNNITLPRWINTISHSPCELHGFSDASHDAMAAAVYLKTHSLFTGPKVTLICTKTKVAPLKKLTVPRLELTAALMLAELTHYVQATLNVNITSTFLWTDSTVTLTWINTRPDRWKDFVQNRIIQIKELTPNTHWRHVPGKFNPANCASRGITTTYLAKHELWWKGPTWLTQAEEHWPKQKPLNEQTITTEALIATLRRFNSRRGIPHTLYSDCGKNFIDAEIKRLFIQYTREHEAVSKFIIDSGTQWLFNSPAAPHMGGKWESVVKSIKYHLNRVIKGHSMTFEEFYTLLIQIEALLNSRPLEPLTDDSENLEALTPGHFLTGSTLTAFLEPTITDLNLTHLNRRQFIQLCTQHFWARWSRSYLQKLNTSNKWFQERDDIKVGSLALLTDKRFPPSIWPLARVMRLHPGPDGLTGVATIKRATTTLTRPIVKLATLPVITTPTTSTSRGSPDAGKS